MSPIVAASPEVAAPASVPGPAPDRGVLFFAPFAGDDPYGSADGESQGGAVKPWAVAFFADLLGDDTYRGGGNGYVRAPEKGREKEWPKAFFLDFAGTDVYPPGGDGPPSADGASLIAEGSSAGGAAPVDARPCTT